MNRHRSNTAGIIAAGLLLLVLLPSCSQLIGGKTVIRQSRKFVIDDSVPLRLELPLSGRPYPYEVAVERFDVSRLYARDQVVLRLSTEEISEDPLLRWAHRPGDMITDAVEGYLRQSFLFKDVRQEFLDEPDFTLTGSVKAIERIDSGDRWFAKLAISMQLVDRDAHVVWLQDFGFDPEESVEVFDEDFVHTVSRMKQMLYDYMVQTVRGIDLKILIRKWQKENRDVPYLIEQYENGNAVSPTADSPDAGAGRILVPHPDYDVIPGKPAP